MNDAALGKQGEIYCRALLGQFRQLAYASTACCV